MPFGVRWRGVELPLPAVLAVVVSGLAFASVLAYHDRARWVGGGWMLFGLVAYVVYRRVVEGTTLTERVSVTEEALTKRVPQVEYRTILVPVFDEKLDDEVVGTAGRLAVQAERRAVAEDRPRLDLVYVIEVPLTLPLDANLGERIDGTRQQGDRPGDGRRRRVPGRRCDLAGGAGPLDRFRDRAGGAEGGAEAIVIGGEPPTKIRGGAVLGGIGGRGRPRSAR